ncbi:spore germination protein [Brevibacillus fluminis]|uniref:Spore germination protein n=1 Tax=Brevibacillus fluminis TaxID=511487 RepID=A0A3M8CUS2_9BACL|nr:spore germination protein [Brevibacillus fluminis]RNB79562.1 spore germination protein [Brevibacillus fluminis]
MNGVEELQAAFRDTSDFVSHPIQIGDDCVTLLYLNSLVDQTFANEHIGQNIHPLPGEGGPILTPLPDLQEAITAILSGNIVVFFENSSAAYVSNGGGSENRTIQAAENESIIRGPRDSFVESLHVNLSLIRRRFPDIGLKVQTSILGRRSKTKVALVFVDDIVNPTILQEVQSRLATVDIDEVLDCGTIEQWIQDSWYSPFPQAQYTELPVRVVSAIGEGRVAIFVDGSPSVLIVPMTFSMLFQAPDDYFERWLIGSAIRTIRFLGAVIALILPSLYIALVSFHPGMIPTQLTLSIAATRAQVPFPSILEALMMETTLEMLREAGMRLPKVMGQTIGIVGGLVIGQSAVEAGIVSPVMVIVVGITAISSFLVPAYNGAIALRLLRFPLMILAGTLGLFGVILGILTVAAHLISLKSFGINYFSPFAPYRPSDWKDIIIRAPLTNQKERPEILHPLDRVRMNLRKRKKGW